MEDSGHLVEVGSFVLEIVTTDADLDLFGLRTGDLHLGDSVDLLQLRFDHVLEIRGQLVFIGVGGHGEGEHRNIVGAHHHDVRFDPVGQGRLHLGDRALQSTDDVIGVVAVLRAHGDLRTARRGCRGHVLDFGQCGQRPFEGVGDFGFDGLGGRPLVGGGDRGLWVVEGWEELLLEGTGSDDAEDDGDDGDQRDERPVLQAQSSQETHRRGLSLS